MSVKVLGVGDPHARISTIADVERLAVKIRDTATKHQVERIVVLGDLFNDFSKIHLLVLRAVVKFFEILLESGAHIVYVVGNHDMMNNQVFLEDYHALTPFKHWGGRLTIVDTPMAYGGFVFCPYVAPGRFKEAVGPLVKEKLKSGLPVYAIFCHQEFKGAKMGAVESKVGDEWDSRLPLVISGHIHDHGLLQRNILYIGAPSSQAYSESTDKTVSVFEFNDDGSWTEERIDLGMPKRLTYSMSVEELKKFVIPENSYVRVNLVDTVEEITKFKKSKGYDALAEKIKIVPKPTDKVYVKSSVNHVSYMEILRQSIENESPAVKTAFDELTQSGEKNAA